MLQTLLLCQYQVIYILKVGNSTLEIKMNYVAMTSDPENNIIYKNVFCLDSWGQTLVKNLTGEAKILGRFPLAK